MTDDRAVLSAPEPTRAPEAGASSPTRFASPGVRGSVHDLSNVPWVRRTPDSDRIPIRVRLRTSWPLLRKYAVRQIQLRYSQSALGMSWTVVQPVAIMAIYGFVLTQFLDVDGGDLPYLSVAWAGLTVWMYVQAGIQAGVVSLRNDAWLLSRVWFPREVIPLAPVLAGLIDLAVAAGILAGIAVVQGVGLSIHAVAALVPVAVLVLWVAALSVLTATITVFFRDLATIVALGLRLLFIASPVMYPASVIPPEFGWVNAVNPFAAVIHNVRATVLGHAWPNWELLAVHTGIAILLLLGGLWYLRAVERRMVDII